MRPKLLLASVILISCITSLKAEVYRWQDAAGRWHFSDQPVDDKGRSIAPSSATTTEKNAATDDSLPNNSLPDDSLQDKLQQKFKPDSAISRVTLSVVAIETHMGSGSGFFISDQGHIITNKHVIRPMPSKSADNNEQKLKDEADALTRMDADIQHEQQQLKDYKIKLDEFARSLANMAKGGARDLSQADYDNYQKTYHNRLQTLQKYQQEFKTRKTTYDKTQGDFNWNNNLAKVATQFKVFLKDNTQLSAKLLAISKTQDLALLQLLNQKTSALNFYGQALNQGMRVYAIGSPLGMRDAMTSGIITRLDQNFVTTDAQILPGNSGGPLVTEEGLVIGVNTLKFGENVNGAGFGLAIPINEVRKEFKSYLPSLAN
jgi:S1-C subfamily serine protease